jgi:hypothetical protein
VKVILENYWLLNLPVLLLVLWQDIKYRSIYWWLPVPVFLTGIAFNYHFIIEKLIPSTILLFAHLAIIYLYFFIKNKFKGAYLNEDILGLGDVLILLSFTPYFNPAEMILFIFSGMIFSMIAFLAIRVYKPKPHTVPLAGLISLFFIFFYPLAIRNNKLNEFLLEYCNFVII